MLDYKGIHCPVCGRAFADGDDIVVCPQCGAPYHRECYRQVGECIFQDLHQKGEDWAPPAPAAAALPREEPSAEIKDRECPICGTLNAHSATFCNRCGASLLGRSGDIDDPDGEETPPQPFGGMPGMPGMPFAFGDPMGGVSPAETLDEGVTYGDASKLVRVNTAYYMPVFKRIKTQQRSKFNFSAFLFSGGWFLYRKQYKLGAVITGIMLALYAAFLCLYLLVAVPAMKEVAGQEGIDLMNSQGLTTQETLVLSQALAEDGTLMAKISGFLVIPPVMLAVMLFCGFKANKFYLDHCVKTVRDARAGGEDLSQVWTEKGGVNSFAALGAAIGLIVLRMALLITMGYGLF